MCWPQEVDSDIAEKFLRRVAKLHEEECGMGSWGREAFSKRDLSLWKQSS